MVNAFVRLVIQGELVNEVSEFDFNPFPVHCQ